MTVPQFAAAGKLRGAARSMPARSLSQASFFDPEFADPGCLEQGTVPWVLARHSSTLFPSWILRGWHGEGRLGRDAWPAAVLMKLEILRWCEEGMSRRAAARMARQNTAWRAAMGLRLGTVTPSEKVLREFERFLRQRHPDAQVPRYLVLHEHWVRLALSEGVVGPKSNWAMDSSPMWCYGAVLDTVRLLGDGLRMLARQWSELTGVSLSSLATAWQAPWLTAKSTKGALPMDWHKSDAKANAIDDMATKVVHAVEEVRRKLLHVRPGKRKALLRRCRSLVRVVRDDLETDAAGRLVIAQRVASDRLVSMTDPQARHGRKSRSKTFNGFKVHVLGEVVSGLIAAVSVTAGNGHDGAPAHQLIRRAHALHQGLTSVLADTAYGGARLRHLVRRTEGIDLLAPPPAATLAEGLLGRERITFDFDAGTATCSQGVTTSDRRLVWSPEYGVEVPRFKWEAKTCNACPVKDACRGSIKGANQVKLHPYERELRAARAAWKQTDVRTRYRERSQCERLVNQLTRHGARRARGWGLGAAHLQAHVIAMRCNLGLLARAWAAKEAQASAACGKTK